MDDFDVDVESIEEFFTERKKVMIFLHCLDMTGGVLAALNLIRVMSKEKYQITAVSETDGYLREEFTKHGVEVKIINSKDFYKLKKTVEEYDYIMANTLLMWEVVNLFNGSDVPVLWWLHESPSYFVVHEEAYSPEFFGKLRENVKLLSAGNFVQNFVAKRYGVKSSVLNFGIPDMKDVEIAKSNLVADKNKITFLCAASAYMPIKGQDLLALAIVQLPQEYRERCEFFFVADEKAGKLEIFEMILLASKICGNVHPFGMLEHDSLMQLMKQSDCIVVPSREDATNTCAVEAMSMSKICISSNMAGISYYIEDGNNGYVFESENVNALMQKIMIVIDTFDNSKKIQKQARETYEKHFSMESFSGNIDVILKNCKKL